MSITYLGHSCFLIEENNHKILIDPFLICVPNFSFDGITDILVTHGHGDHLGSAIEISQKTGAKITAIFELANYCNQKGANAQGIGFGSWIEYEWGKLIAVPATHTSSTPDNIYAGNPCGFILDFGKFKIYHLRRNLQPLNAYYILILLTNNLFRFVFLHLLKIAC